MSYLLHLWREPIPVSLAQAESLRVDLRSQVVSTPDPRVRSLIDNIAARLPADHDPDDYWTEEPELEPASPLLTLSPRTQELTTVLPAVLDAAREQGWVVHDGQDLLGMHDPALRRLRWGENSLGPQGAMTALNPVMRVRDQNGDSIWTHEGGSPARALRARSEEMLGRVGRPVRTLYAAGGDDRSSRLQRRADRAGNQTDLDQRDRHFRPSGRA